MNNLVVSYKLDTRNLTRAVERDSDTQWKGAVNVGMSNLLDMAQSYPDYNDEYDYSYGKELDSGLRSGIADRIEKMISDIPVVRNKNDSVSERFLALQEWEGIVTEIHGELFTARLKDITNKSNPEEVGDFLIEDIRKDDLKLLRPGSIFRWVIGYEIKKSGSKRRSSQIVFRRLPMWSERELKAADQEAQELLGSINWE